MTRKVKQTQPATLQMPTEFIAQNGAAIHQTPNHRHRLPEGQEG